MINDENDKKEFQLERQSPKRI